MTSRWGCIALVLVCASEVAGTGLEEPAAASLEERIRETSEVCASGDATQAAASLRALLDDLERQLDPASSALQIVRLNLASAEKAIGRESEGDALTSQALSVETADPEPHPELASALSGLRACSQLRSGKSRRPPPLNDSAILTADAGTQLSAARRLYAKGQYANARIAAEQAIAEVDASSDAFVTAHEMLALILLGLGEHDAALVAARDAGAAARRLKLDRPSNPAGSSSDPSR